MSTRSQSPQPSPSPRLRSRSRSHQRALNNAGRRGHTKSRLGCKTCKRRKVKCDEGRPSCGNCSKHGVVCDFVPLYSEEASPDEFTLPFPSVINPHLNNLTDHHHNHHNHHNHNGDAAAAAATPSSPGIDLLDLELLHNFTTYTYATLGSDQAMRNMMRTTAVKMAVGCEYLMRTILALSALHLAHFRKDKTDVYVNRALAHHQVASRQATALMGELKKEDCENLHLFTVMTVFVALGFPRNADYSLLLGTSVIPDWLPLLTTSEPILQVLKPREYRGRLKPLFSYGTARSRVVMSNDHPPPPWLLADLRTLVNETCRKPHFLPVYNHVIDDLRSMLALLVPHKQRDEEEYPSGGGGGSATAATTPSSQTATPAAGQLPPPSPPQLEAWDVLVWQWKFSDDFARLLRGPEPEQEAVAIYSHFFIMLKRLESQWWLEGWATHLMEKAWAVLDEEHRGWVQWPIEELGWVPP